MPPMPPIFPVAIGCSESNNVHIDKAKAIFEHYYNLLLERSLRENNLVHAKWIKNEAITLTNEHFKGIDQLLEGFSHEQEETQIMGLWREIAKNLYVPLKKIYDQINNKLPEGEHINYVIESMSLLQSEVRYALKKYEDYN